MRPVQRLMNGKPPKLLPALKRVLFRPKTSLAIFKTQKAVEFDFLVNSDFNKLEPVLHQKFHVIPSNVLDRNASVNKVACYLADKDHFPKATNVCVEVIRREAA